MKITIERTCPTGRPLFAAGLIAEKTLDSVVDPELLVAETTRVLFRHTEDARRARASDKAEPSA